MIGAFMAKNIGIFFLFLSMACTSYEQFRHMTEQFEIPSKTYNTNFHQTWQAVLDVMKKYDLEISNQESGAIRTRWIDNTRELNFTNSFAVRDNVKSARMKIIVNVIKGFRGTQEVTKVTIFKRQLIERDFLQGQRIVPTDRILEETILYRLEKILANNVALKAIEDQKAKEMESSFKNLLCEK